MTFFEAVADKWKRLCKKLGPVLSKIGQFLTKVGHGILRVWRYAVRFKKVILAVPVIWGTVWLAVENITRLPDNVGLGLQTDGTFSMMLPKVLAILGPVAVTALCLLLMFCSKRTLTPWLVSLFSLVFPILLWIINAYPA